MDHAGHGSEPDYNAAAHDHTQHQRHIEHVHNVDPSTEIYGQNIPWAYSANGTAAGSHADHTTHLDGGGSGVHSMMTMTFHFGADETVLFSWWAIHGAGPMVASFIGVFILAMLYEGLKFYRDRLLCRTYSPLPYKVVECGHHGVVNTENGSCGGRARQEGCIDKPVGEDDLLVIEHKMFSWSHSWQTVLHALQVTISYCLMLIFMTYNVWLCLAVVLGATVGYLVFGCRKSYVVDVTEHCH